MEHSPVFASFLLETEKWGYVTTLDNSSLTWVAEYMFLGFYKLYNVLHTYFKKY